MQKYKDVSVVPSWDPELGTRLSSVFTRIGGNKKSGELVGVTDEQIGRWKSGKAKIPFYAAALICDEAGVTLDWLATGKSMDADEAPFDKQLFFDVIELVENFIRDEGKDIPPAKRGPTYWALYKAILRDQAKREDGQPVVVDVNDEAVQDILGLFD